MHRLGKVAVRVRGVIKVKLSKNFKIKIHKTVILSVGLYEASLNSRAV
jgi:hypothetical protein